METVNKEKLDQNLIDEITPILESHRQELSRYDDMVLNPNWDVYYKMQEVGQFYLYVCRDEDNKIVGYAAFFTMQNLHYKDFIYAHQDVFYVTQDKRGSRVAVKLLKATEELFEVADVIVHHAKFTNRFGEFLEKFGYHKAEATYHKRG